jgi:tetratricopeptide (TPR) repeat protein
MNKLLAFAAALLLSACASAPVTLRDAGLFHDAPFHPPLATLSPDEIFALSPAMKLYLDTDIARESHSKGRIHGLIDTLYMPGRLKLDYDTAYTRTAQEAFESRSGNCLSLVVMTAAFARAMGVPVRFHNVYSEESWTRHGNTLFASGHVNLTLGSVHANTRTRLGELAPLTIDFVRPDPNFLQRAWPIGEETIAAMFMNNRAAEALARGDTRAAYWWARRAIEQDPKFFAAYNTLGVVYRRANDYQQAERVLRHVLAHEPGNVNVMSNLAVVMDSLGRVTEAARLAAEVERLRPIAPFHYFDLGVAAMKRQDYRAARDLFIKEIERAAYHAEFHFWLGAAYAGLNDTRRAQKHLAIAVEHSATRRDQDIYAAKLELVRARGS